MSEIFDITDVVELRTWASDSIYSVSALKEDLEAVLSEDEADNAETLSIEIFDELEFRASLLQESYPFKVDGSTVSTNNYKDNSSYLFCLGLNFFNNITLNLRTIEFESIVKIAAEKYFCGTAIRIGSGWKAEKVSTYKELLEKVSSLVPDIGAPIRTKAPKGGDGGWDVVVVKNFADNQFTRLTALGNCATGKTNWLGKARDTEPDYFWKFFTRVSSNPCLIFLAIPFIMTEDQRQRKQGRELIVFDRFRICGMAPNTSQKAMNWLEKNRAKALDFPLI
jgi:hypothetical protein